MATARPLTIALDLEGTLVSNAVSVFPRNGLRAFLDHVGRIADEVVVCTSVSHQRAVRVLELLVDDGCAPVWAAGLRVVSSGHTKDLSEVADLATTRVLLVDDRHDVLPPDQAHLLVPVDPWVAPYGPDDALADALARLRARAVAGH